MLKTIVLFVLSLTIKTSAQNLSVHDLPIVQAMFTAGLVPEVKCSTIIHCDIFGNVYMLNMSNVYFAHGPDISEYARAFSRFDGLIAINSQLVFNTTKTKSFLLEFGVTARNASLNAFTLHDVPFFSRGSNRITLVNTSFDRGLEQEQVLNQTLDISWVQVVNTPINGLLPRSTCKLGFSESMIENTRLTDLPACMQRTAFWSLRDNPLRCVPWNESFYSQHNKTVQRAVKCNEHSLTATCSGGHGTCVDQDQFSSLQAQGIAIPPCLDPAYAQQQQQPSYMCVCNGFWTGILCQFCNTSIASVTSTGDCVRNYSVLIPQCTHCHVNGQCVADNVCVCNYGYLGDGVQVCSSFCNTSIASVTSTGDCVRNYSLLAPQCIHCHANGQCVADNVCVCKDGYVGDGVYHCSIGQYVSQSYIFCFEGNQTALQDVAVQDIVVGLLLSNQTQLSYQVQGVNQTQQDTSRCALNQTGFLLKWNVLSPDTVNVEEPILSAHDLAQLLSHTYLFLQEQQEQNNSLSWQGWTVEPAEQQPVGMENTTNTTRELNTTPPPPPQIIANANSHRITFSLLDKMPMWGLLVMALVLAIGLGSTWFAMRRKWPQANNALVVTLTIQFIDVILDWFIVTTLMQSLHTIGWIYILSLIVPMLGNMSLMAWIVHSETRDNASFRDWMLGSSQVTDQEDKTAVTRHQTILSLSILVGLFNTQNLALVYSQLFDKTWFCAPLTQRTMDRLRVGSIITTIGEDLVQFILVLVLTLTQRGAAGATLGLSLLLNLLTLLAAASRHSVALCTLRNRARPSRIARV